MSMRTETLQLVISGDGKLLGAELGKSEKQIKGFAGKAGGMFTGLGKSITGAVGKLANPLALIGGGAGILLAARNLIDYQDSLSSLGITAGMSAEQMMTLDRRIHDLAYTTGQSREGLVSAIRSMASNVDTDFAVEAIKHVGEAATAMSFDIGEAAKVFTIFRRDLGATADEAAGLFNMMMGMNQGTGGLNRIASSVANLGLTKDNFAQYNALIQSTKSIFGGEEAAAAAIDQIAMRTLGRQGRTLRRRIGDDLFTEDGRIKDFRAFMERTANVLNERQMQTIFGARSSRAFLHFQSGDGLRIFDDYIKRGQDAGRVSDALAWKQAELRFQINALGTAAKEFAGYALSPVLADLTTHLNALTSNPQAMDEFRDNLRGIATLFGDIATIGATAAKVINPIFKSPARDIRLSKHMSTTSKMVPKSDYKDLLKEFYNNPDWFLRKYNIDKKEFDQQVRSLSPGGRFNVGVAHKLAIPQAWQYKQQENERIAEVRNRIGVAHKLPVSQSSTPATQEITVSAPEVKNTLNINLQIPENGRPVIEAPAGTSVKATVNRGVFN